MLKKSLCTIGLFSSAVWVSGIQAEEFLDNRWYLSPMGTLVVPDGERQANEDYGAYLGIGKIVNRYFNIELKSFYHELDRDRSAGGGRFHQTGVGIDGLVFLNRQAFSPYAVVGAGGLHTSVPGIDDWHPSVEAGLGFMFKLNDYGTSLRSDVRYRYDADSDSMPGVGHFDDLVFNLGFSIPLGKPPEPVKVAEKPAPAPADSDGDGVPDESDRCPGTPPGVAVDEYGCELDSDGDGVPDSKDQCPNTMEGAEVDEVGCPIPQVINLKGVHFEFDSARLVPGAVTILDSAAATLKDNPALVVEVAGHTDSVGAEDYNLDLSQRRAQAVVDYLKARGVTNELKARGYGESEPIADNSEEEGRAANRRVELVILNQ